jgi:pimeloyl-ACP methyl ester carboxylesterase
MNILCHPIISDILFYPDRIAVDDPCSINVGDAVLECFYYEFKDNAPLIVFFHGNGETVSDYSDTLPGIFSIIGCNTFLVEYRGYGKSSGVSNLVNLITDSEIVVSYVTKFSDKIILFGRSLGCLPAIHAAAAIPNIYGIVLENGIADLYEYIEPKLMVYDSRWFYSHTSPIMHDIDLSILKLEINKQFNHQDKLSRFYGKSLITCSAHDHNVSNNHSEWLFRWLREPKKIERFDNCDHNSIFAYNYKEYCELLFKLIY